MPKLVDNYVLNRKIGAGQFGEVLKGYDRTTNNDIAVKVIKRENLKGKFVELLENEIKVLKGCDNTNIIRLYDLKKTPNNFYLVLQYCNEGDLAAYVKKKKQLTEDEAVEFLVQILHGFRTLVKNKILHRDFKLANILLHDGQIKIADFGFAKLLTEDEFTKTILGSPLNMAPEVIKGRQYNSKADIYSIGVCFYEMLFGKPPFNAPNIMELEKVIKKQDIPFPRHINKISSMAEGLIRSMLAYDPQKRIDWPELFEHPITRTAETDMSNMLQETLGKGGGDLLSNMSKFYIKNNMVILHPAEILKKQDINNFAFDVVKNNKKVEYKGQAIRRDIQAPNRPNKLKRQDAKEDKLEEKEAQSEVITKSSKTNSRYLLNERNKVVFILSVIKEVEDRLNRKNSKPLLFKLGEIMMERARQLQAVLLKKDNPFKLTYWQEYLDNPEFETLSNYFAKELDIINYQHEQLSKVAQKTAESLPTLLTPYIKDGVDELRASNKPYEEINRVNWIHLDHLLDLPQVDVVMRFVNDDEFNFKMYYLDNGKISMEELVEKVMKKAKL